MSSVCFKIFGSCFGKYFSLSVSWSLPVLRFKTAIYNSWMLLFSYLWLYYFWSPTSSYMFSLGWRWETTQKLKSINNKYFMCVTINKMTKGNIGFVIPVMINYTRTRQYVWSKCYITNWCFKRLWTWSLLFYISQELRLSTNTVVLKQGKL